MKKAIAILLLTTYLFSTTELSQLLKLPALVNHFIEHQDENKDLTLWEFMDIHYAHGIVKDADYEKDMKLPFKTMENFSIQISIAVPPSFIVSSFYLTSFVISNKNIYTYLKKDTHILSNDSLTAVHLSSIWQPPRFC